MVVSLLSCIEIIVGGVREKAAKSWMHGIAILSDEAFHVIMCVS